jgi:DNA-binding response OmpR family regulator
MDAASDAHAGEEPAREGWRLANKGWTLISPRGRTLGLTTGERDFLSRLVRAPDRKVSRDAFIADGADDTDSGLTRRRFVDVMISRQRR